MAVFDMSFQFLKDQEIFGAVEAFEVSLAVLEWANGGMF